MTTKAQTGKHSRGGTFLKREREIAATYYMCLTREAHSVTKTPSVRRPERKTKPPAKERKVNAEKSVWESLKSSRTIFLLNQQEIIKSGHQESAKGHCHTLALTTGGVFTHSQQGGGLLYTNKDYRTVLTPGETQEPLKVFLNTYLPTYLLAHQYNPPSSPHT